MTWALVLFLAQAAAPTQIDRGEALFHDAAKGCGACHSLKGKGTAVGPDLKDMSRLSPRAIAMAVRSTVTQYVQVVKLKSGEQFPAMPPKDTATEVYDLSKIPPVSVKATKADIASTTPNANWKHPGATMKLTPEEMADVISYIRFAGANNRQAVSPDDVK
jgi:mono/diheme cytochrome c family protein